jgi:hypothetical protein
LCAWCGNETFPIDAGKTMLSAAIAVDAPKTIKVAATKKTFISFLLSFEFLNPIFTIVFIFYNLSRFP